MVKKASTKKSELLSKLDITINNEDWNGNKEDVVTISNGKTNMKFSLNRFKTIYGEFVLNR